MSYFALGCKLLKAYSTSWSPTSENDLCKASHQWTYQSFHNTFWWNVLAIPNWLSFMWPCSNILHYGHAIHVITIFFGNLHITIPFGFYDFHMWLDISCKGHVQLMTYELLNPCRPLVAKDNDVISSYKSQSYYTLTFSYFVIMLKFLVMKFHGVRCKLM